MDKMIQQNNSALFTLGSTAAPQTNIRPASQAPVMNVSNFKAAAPTKARAP